MMAFLRVAIASDLPAINGIYNHYVSASTCTYQTEPSTQVEREQWFAAYPRDRYPINLAVDAVGEVLGWGALRPFHARAAYRFTVENSVYVHPDHHRQGIGRALLTDLIARAQALGYRSIVALISADQGPSIALHRSQGFVEAGRLRNAGCKFNRWLDVLYMQKSFEPFPEFPGT